MTIDELRSFRNAVPFRPFWLKLDDERTFFVEQPSYIGFSPNQTLVLVVSREQTAWFAPDKVQAASHRPLARSA